ncbi:hypothetical protein AGDE_04836 [Angomonas deanei]|nr:hypothetical protein AGDE_04836 [Angomonas deanei]|eukprot:EPY39093.1 hypothetical protein AGDE_04836 [Angomonas deanei]
MGTGQSVVVQQHLSKWEAALGELENISQTNRKLIEQDRIFGSSPESADAVVRRPSSLVSFGNNGNVVSGGEADNNIVSSSSIGGIGHRPRSGHQQSPGDSRQGEGRGFDSRSGTNSNQAPKHNRQQVLEVKKARVELFSSYVAKNPEALTNVMQCSHFGATAVGLSYLLGGKKDSPDRRNRVTVEDLFFAAQVPLHMLHTSPPHLPVLADIVREFLDVDNRFKDEYGVEEVHFDVSPTVGQVDLGPNEVGDRQTRMQLPEFCRVITRDCEEETSVIRIVNYDPYVLEQEMIVDAYDDDEEQQNSPLATSVLGVGPRHVQRRFSPDNDGAYAVIVDVRNAVQLMVTIAEGIVNDSLHVKMTEVPAASLFKAMMTAEEGHRARGFLRIFKKEPGTPGFGDQVNSFWSPELCSGKVLGTLAEGTHAATISHHISPHIVAVAWAIHLLKGVRNDAHGYGSGLPVSDIIRTLRFPSQVFIDGSLPLEQVFEYAKEFLSVKQLPYVATLHPVLTKISREDAVPTISVFDLESIIMDVQKSNDDVESPQHVMVLMYNACVAHNVLYIAEEPQWCVLAGYDTETQTALLIDAHPKTFSRTWTCSLERVHKAITGTGYIIFSKTGEGSENVGAPKTVSPMVLSRLQLLKEQAGMGVQSWKVQPLVKTLTFPALPVMPTIISIVCTKLLEKVITIEDVIYTVPYEVSSLLIRFFTLESLQVCLSEFLQYSGLADTVQVTSHHVERKASGGMSLLLKDFEKLVTDATVEGKALIVHFDRKRLQVHGVNHPFGSLGVVTAYNPASKIVTVMDCNPNAYLRTWSTRLGSSCCRRLLRGRRTDKHSVRSVCQSSPTGATGTSPPTFPEGRRTVP